MLLESFAVWNGVLEQPDAWFARAQTAAAHSTRTGVEVWTVTARVGQPFDGTRCAVAWWGMVLWGFKGFGWGETLYAAPSGVMPSRDCAAPQDLPRAGAYVSGVVQDGTRFTRRTETGYVEVDLTRRAGRVVREAARRFHDARPGRGPA